MEDRSEDNVLDRSEDISGSFGINHRCAVNVDFSFGGVREFLVNRDELFLKVCRKRVKLVKANPSR